MSQARPWSIARLRAAIARRLRGPYASLDRIEQRVEVLAGQAEELQAHLTEMEASRLQDRIAASRLREDLRDALRALAANELQNRRSLSAVREDPDYLRAWDDDAPLISVTVATLGRPS